MAQEPCFSGVPAAVRQKLCVKLGYQFYKVTGFTGRETTLCAGVPENIAANSRLAEVADDCFFPPFIIIWLDGNQVVYEKKT